MREIEIKLRFDSADEARRQLGLAGAVAMFPRSFEDNRVYDDAERSFSRNWRLLRLRDTRGKRILTYKHPPESTDEGVRYKVRIEHEAIVFGDGIEDILAALGYEQIWRYQKFRQRYQLEGLKIELDELPFGVFLEIEGEPREIDRVAASLGFDPASYIRETYRELFCEHEGSDDPGDMIFPDAE